VEHRFPKAAVPSIGFAPRGICAEILRRAVAYIDIVCNIGEFPSAQLVQSGRSDCALSVAVR